MKSILLRNPLACRTRYISLKNVLYKLRAGVRIYLSLHSIGQHFLVLLAEKAAFKEMLHFLYAGSLSPQLNEPTASVRELVDLLVVGDKFEVPSFMGAVLKALNRTDLTIANSVVIALEVPKALQNCPPIKKFVDEARAHIVDSFKDVTATWATPEFMGLSMGAVQLLLQSEELEADSEEETFYKLLGWLRMNFSGMKERQRALDALSQFVRFCCMSGEYLEELLARTKMRYSKATSALISTVVKFQSYSDEKKQAMEIEAGERKGVRDVHLEIVAFRLSEDPGEAVYSETVDCCGLGWQIGVHDGEVNQGKPGVGLYLFCDEASGNQTSLADQKDIICCRFYVRTWPNGFWKLLGKYCRALSSFEEEGYGPKDALGCHGASQGSRRSTLAAPVRWRSKSWRVGLNTGAESLGGPDCTPTTQSA
jgi:hypothetical protein